MNATDIINLAVPFFLLLMLIEALASWRRGWQFYSLNDTLLNLSLGSTRQVVDIFTKVFLFAAYTAIYNWGHWLDLSVSAWWQWPLVIVAVDFLYYWQHRWSHEINLLWAGHLVHHSSEEFNISVALRQSFVHDLMVYPLYFLLALLGLPPFEFFIGVAFLAIYQYWIHTRAVPRLPEWVESIFNTPSAHRVHHGSNPQYLDKNYAGVFMLIDRLFGTYAREEEPVRYGLTVPVKTWNPLWANAHYFIELFSINAKTTRWRDKLRLWAKHPGWLPAELNAAAEDYPNAGNDKFKTHISRSVWHYALFQYALAGAAILPVMLAYQQLTVTQIALMLSFSVLSGCNVGGLQQASNWAATSEQIKWLVSAVVSLTWVFAIPETGPIGLVVTALAAISLLWLQAIRGEIRLLPNTASL